MPLKNYTSKVPADQSIREIQAGLIKAGAIGIQYRYENGGRVESLAFQLSINGKPVAFSLPVSWRLFQVVLKKQKVKGWEDEHYVYRVAWRNIRDWVLAQLALYETAMVELPQVFMPFATVDRAGRTLYEHVKSGQLLLGDGR